MSGFDLKKIFFGFKFGLGFGLKKIFLRFRVEFRVLKVFFLIGFGLKILLFAGLCVEPKHPNCLVRVYGVIWMCSSVINTLLIKIKLYRLTFVEGGTCFFYP